MSKKCKITPSEINLNTDLNPKYKEMLKNKSIEIDETPISQQDTDLDLTQEVIDSINKTKYPKFTLKEMESKAKKETNEVIQSEYIKDSISNISDSYSSKKLGTKKDLLYVGTAAALLGFPTIGIGLFAAPIIAAGGGYFTVLMAAQTIMKYGMALAVTKTSAMGDTRLDEIRENVLKFIVPPELRVSLPPAMREFWNEVDTVRAELGKTINNLSQGQKNIDKISKNIKSILSNDTKIKSEKIDKYDIFSLLEFLSTPVRRGHSSTTLFDRNAIDILTEKVVPFEGEDSSTTAATIADLMIGSLIEYAYENKRGLPFSNENLKSFMKSVDYPTELIPDTINKIQQSAQSILEGYGDVLDRQIYNYQQKVSNLSARHIATERILDFVAKKMANPAANLVNNLPEEYSTQELINNPLYKMYSEPEFIGGLLNTIKKWGINSLPTQLEIYNNQKISKDTPFTGTNIKDFPKSNITGKLPPVTALKTTSAPITNSSGEVLEISIGSSYILVDELGEPILKDGEIVIKDQYFFETMPLVKNYKTKEDKIRDILSSSTKETKKAEQIAPIAFKKKFAETTDNEKTKIKTWIEQPNTFSLPSQENYNIQEYQMGEDRYILYKQMYDTSVQEMQLSSIKEITQRLPYYTDKETGKSFYGEPGANYIIKIYPIGYSAEGKRRPIITIASPDDLPKYILDNQSNPNISSDVRIPIKLNTGDFANAYVRKDKNGDIYGTIEQEVEQGEPAAFAIKIESGGLVRDITSKAIIGNINIKENISTYIDKEIKNNLSNTINLSQTGTVQAFFIEYNNPALTNASKKRLYQQKEYLIEDIQNYIQEYTGKEITRKEAINIASPILFPRSNYADIANHAVKSFMPLSNIVAKRYKSENRSPHFFIRSHATFRNDSSVNQVTGTLSRSKSTTDYLSQLAGQNDEGGDEYSKDATNIRNANPDFVFIDEIVKAREIISEVEKHAIMTKLASAKDDSGKPKFYTESPLQADPKTHIPITIKNPATTTGVINKRFEDTKEKLLKLNKVKEQVSKKLGKSLEQLRSKTTKMLGNPYLTFVLDMAVVNPETGKMTTTPVNVEIPFNRDGSATNRIQQNIKAAIISPDGSKKQPYSLSTKLSFEGKPINTSSKLKIKNGILEITNPKGIVFTVPPTGLDDIDQIWEREYDKRVNQKAQDYLSDVQEYNSSRNFLSQYNPNPSQIAGYIAQTQKERQNILKLSKQNFFDFFSQIEDEPGSLDLKRGQSIVEIVDSMSSHLNNLKEVISQTKSKETTDAVNYLDKLLREALESKGSAFKNGLKEMKKMLAGDDQLNLPADGEIRKVMDSIRISMQVLNVLDEYNEQLNSTVHSDIVDIIETNPKTTEKAVKLIPETIKLAQELTKSTELLQEIQSKIPGATISILPINLDIYKKKEDRRAFLERGFAFIPIVTKENNMTTIGLKWNGEKYETFEISNDKNTYITETIKANLKSPSTQEFKKISTIEQLEVIESSQAPYSESDVIATFKDRPIFKLVEFTNTETLNEKEAELRLNLTYNEYKKRIEVFQEARNTISFVLTELENKMQKSINSALKTVAAQKAPIKEISKIDQIRLDKVTNLRNLYYAMENSIAEEMKLINKDYAKIQENFKKTAAGAETILNAAKLEAQMISDIGTIKNQSDKYFKLQKEYQDLLQKESELNLQMQISLDHARILSSSSTKKYAREAGFAQALAIGNTLSGGESPNIPDTKTIYVLRDIADWIGLRGKEDQGTTVMFNNIVESITQAKNPIVAAGMTLTRRGLQRSFGGFETALQNTAQALVESGVRSFSSLLSTEGEAYAIAKNHLGEKRAKKVWNEITEDVTNVFNELILQKNQDLNLKERYLFDPKKETDPISSFSAKLYNFFAQGKLEGTLITKNLFNNNYAEGQNMMIDLEKAKLKTQKDIIKTTQKVSFGAKLRATDEKLDFRRLPNFVNDLNMETNKKELISRTTSSLMKKVLENLNKEELYQYAKQHMLDSKDRIISQEEFEMMATSTDRNIEMEYDAIISAYITDKLYQHMAESGDIARIEQIGLTTLGRRITFQKETTFKKLIGALSGMDQNVRSLAYFSSYIEEAVVLSEALSIIFNTRGEFNDRQRKQMARYISGWFSEFFVKMLLALLADWIVKGQEEAAPLHKQLAVEYTQSKNAWSNILNTAPYGDFYIAQSYYNEKYGPEIAKKMEPTYVTANGDWATETAKSVFLGGVTSFVPIGVTQGFGAWAFANGIIDPQQRQFKEGGIEKNNPWYLGGEAGGFVIENIAEALNIRSSLRKTDNIWTEPVQIRVNPNTRKEYSVPIMGGTLMKYFGAKPQGWEESVNAAREKRIDQYQSEFNSLRNKYNKKEISKEEFETKSKLLQETAVKLGGRLTTKRRLSSSGKKSLFKNTKLKLKKSKLSGKLK